MFDFLDNDWFIITIEIVFLVLIAYDIKRYFETKKKEYITNIVLTFAFFVWAAIPFYNSYLTWEDTTKTELIAECSKEDNATTCECVNKELFKEYSYTSYLEMKSSDNDDLKEFIKETKQECLDD